MTNKSEILELKDIPTPTKLVEEFKKIHDFEYKSAFHDLQNHYKLKEESITELLAGIARVTVFSLDYQPTHCRVIFELNTLYLIIQNILNL